MSGSDSKFRDEGQLALLAAGLWRRKAVESGQEGFMISEEEKGAALEVVPKVEDGRIDRQQLPVKCGVTALSGREFGGVEG